MYYLNEVFKNIPSEYNRAWDCDKKKIDGSFGKYFIVKPVKRF